MENTTPVPRLTGCPCGCTTKLPWLLDPDCIRYRPFPEPAGQRGPAEIPLPADGMPIRLRDILHGVL